MIFIIGISVLVGTCKNELLTAPSPYARIKIFIHDEPFKVSDQEVQKLMITIKAIELIQGDQKISLPLTEADPTMDILKITANNPVLLSDHQVLAGTYDQLRLIMKEENTITVDGETFPIICPSGEQTGLKLEGPFIIPPGKLFSFDLDFKPKESIIYNKGQGWKLKPVIEVNSTGTVIGIFRGELTLMNDGAESQAVIELYDNQSFRCKISEHPSITTVGNYFYNSWTKNLTLSNLYATDPSLSKRKTKKLNEQVPDSININVVQWSLDDILVFDILGHQRTLQRVDSFSFSAEYGTTNLTVTVNYPNNSKDDEELIVCLTPLNAHASPDFLDGKLKNGKCSVTFEISNSSWIDAQTIAFKVSAYLFDDINTEFDYEIVKHAGRFGFLMQGAIFTETTDNPWQNDNIAQVTLNQENSYTTSFPKPLNIKIIPENPPITDNPYIRWDEFPGSNGYWVLALIKDRQIDANPLYDDDGKDDWDIAYSKVTEDTEIEVFSDILHFVPHYSDGSDVEPEYLNTGDLLRVEIYALDETGVIDTSEMKGALYMESKTIVVGGVN